LAAFLYCICLKTAENKRIKRKHSSWQIMK
jgi:hypothetical protein